MASCVETQTLFEERIVANGKDIPQVASGKMYQVDYRGESLKELWTAAPDQFEIPMQLQQWEFASQPGQYGLMIPVPLVYQRSWDGDETELNAFPGFRITPIAILVKTVLQHMEELQQTVGDVWLWCAECPYPAEENGGGCCGYPCHLRLRMAVKIFHGKIAVGYRMEGCSSEQFRVAACKEL